MKNTITVKSIANAINNSTTTKTGFISIKYNSTIKTAKDYKSLNVHKQVRATVQAFNTETAYNTAVANSAKKLNVSADNTANAKAFVKSVPHYKHDNNHDCYAIVYNENKDSHYLYVRFIKTHSVVYYVNDVEVTLNDIMQYLTPSALKAVEQRNTPVHNKTNNVTHDVRLRTVGFDSLMSVTINGEVFAK